MLVILPRGCDSERAVIRNDRNVVLERTFGKDPLLGLVMWVTSGNFLKRLGETTGMSDPTKSTDAAGDAREEALGWLAGQFRWESLLADLHELAEGQVVEAQSAAVAGSRWHQRSRRPERVAHDRVDRTVADRCDQAQEPSSEERAVGGQDTN